MRLQLNGYQKTVQQLDGESYIAECVCVSVCVWHRDESSPPTSTMLYWLWSHDWGNSSTTLMDIFQEAADEAVKFLSCERWLVFVHIILYIYGVKRCHVRSCLRACEFKIRNVRELLKDMRQNVYATWFLIGFEPYINNLLRLIQTLQCMQSQCCEKQSSRKLQYYITL